jgi:hypothetical protein
VSDQQGGQPIDPKRVFRQAVCFERAGSLMAGEVSRWFQSFQARALDALRSGPQPFLPDGRPFIVPHSPPPLADVTIPQSMIDRNPMLIPMVVNQAFATELFLKCLLIRDGVPSPRGHELIVLFRQLRPDRQARAEEFYQAECERDGAFQSIQQSEPGKTFDLVWSLTDLNRAFERWRYAYEKLPDNSVLGKPWEAFGRLALELEPSWVSEVADLTYRL